MRILDRYIFKSVVFVFLATILVFSFMYVLIDSASNLDEFIDRNVSLSILATYYVSYLPVVLVDAMSFACMISVLFVYSGLNAHNEIIALRASGLNFWKIGKPALCFALIVASVGFLVNELYIPYAEERTKEFKKANMSLNKEQYKKNRPPIKNLTFYGLKNRLYFIDTFDPNTFELSGVTIIEYDNNQNVKQKIVALKGAWTGIAWKFYQCHVTEFANSINSPTKVKIYQEKLLDIKETPEDFLKQRLNVKSMNIKQLNSYISRFSNSGAKRALNNLRVDLHQKIAFPFRTVVIVLAGLPCAIMLTGRRKGQTFVALGVAIMIGFLYYVSEAVGLALGKGGLFPPIIAAWMAPFIFGGLAVYFIKVKF